VYVQANWWQEFFHGVAIDCWIQAIPADQSRREADAIARALAVSGGSEILDVPCGAGRLSLPLAAAGYRVTGVDLSAESLEHARAADQSGAVRWEQRDMRDLPWRGRFDAAFSAGNSFGYFDDDGDRAFLDAVAAALKPGGRFLLETPMIAESLLPTLQPRPWFKAGEVYLLVRNEYDPARGRLDIEYTFVSHGSIETRAGTHRLYTYRQLTELLERAGFSVLADRAWTPASPTLRLVGTRTG
jgi:SAM-dependent methyltransferase